MSTYIVEYSLFIEIEADDEIEARDRADQIANLNDAYVYIDKVW